ncbi:hypothetical protein PNEG_03196 [Pneumocystis murina B123]|uniref:Nucleoporin POM33 n=1 Tax=Pneumocystis murina (strain B123) TaxID=1069680 RepID=M7NMK9_PNEMU|nr:hypothetical protein PNEG_03196 [Pneumocystis murina B123]EMR08356.1 hypothetical protein PNEG_03196 [Pneumocystis murina B123]
MASHTYIQLPLSRRIKVLVKHPQFVWFIGHSVLLLFSLRYLFSYLTFSSIRHVFSYRCAFLGAILTYSIVVYKTYRKTYTKSKIDLNVILRIWLDENFQYLLLATVWFLSRPVALSLTPYVIFSLFHFLTYLRSNVLPTLNPNALKLDENCIEASICRYIQFLIKQHYDSAMKLVSKVEVILIGTRVLIGAFTFQNSFTVLLFYAFFIRYRYFTSTYTRQTFVHISIYIDHLVADSRVPGSVRNSWVSIKRFIKDYAARSFINAPSDPLTNKESHNKQQ